MDLNLILLFSGIVFFFVLYFADNSFWYKIQSRACQKYCGHCEYCDCWSCTRKEYIDSYKKYRSKKYLEYTKEGKHGL